MLIYSEDLSLDIPVYGLKRGCQDAPRPGSSRILLLLAPSAIAPPVVDPPRYTRGRGCILSGGY